MWHSKESVVKLGSNVEVGHSQRTVRAASQLQERMHKNHYTQNAKNQNPDKNHYPSFHH